MVACSLKYSFPIRRWHQAISWTDTDLTFNKPRRHLTEDDTATSYSGKWVRSHQCSSWNSGFTVASSVGKSMAQVFKNTADICRGIVLCISVCAFDIHEDIHSIVSNEMLDPVEQGLSGRTLHDPTEARSCEIDAQGHNVTRQASLQYCGGAVCRIQSHIIIKIRSQSSESLWDPLSSSLNQ